MPRGIWLDEAISIHQAHLSFHDLFENLQYGDRHPPLHHLVLWLTVRAFGDGELAVRLPSLIAGTLVIPALYLLGRELYDRRTGLVAAAFGAASPLLIWYSQEARMYAFVTLFGLLALWTQLRAIRNPSMGNWAAYILATAALLWSHYFGLLLIGVQQLIFVGVLIHRRRTGEPIRALALGFAYSAGGARPCSSCPCSRSPTSSSTRPARRSARRAGPTTTLSFYAVVSNMAWALWGYHPDGITELLAASWPLLLLLSLLLLGRGGSRQTNILAVAAITPIVLLIVVALYDRELFEVRYFLVAVPLLFLLVARLVTGWIRKPAARLAGGGHHPVHPAPRPGRPADQRRQPAPVRLPRRDRARSRRTPGRRAWCSTSHPTCATCSSTTRPSCAAGRCARGPQAQRGQPGLRARLVPGQQAVLRPDQQGGRQARLPAAAARAQFEKPQTKVWEFR